MDGRKIILLVGALIVAAITAFMARTLMVGTPAPVAEAQGGQGPVAVEGVEVLVATKALPVGTILGPESIKFIPWPKDLIEGAYFKREGTDLKSLQGTVVRFNIPAGQPLTQGAIVKPGDRGFLAAALGAGMRAVTVPVSAQSAVAGFVFPGDRVDLILTQSVAGGGDGPPLKASETVLRNLRVLATDQKTDKQQDEAGNTVVTTYSTVTVEATPRIAEKIAVAQTIGSLSLSLRSIADNQGELEAAIAAGEVTMPSDPKEEKAVLARVASRPAEGGSTMSTGADVSRFQRSTVPGKPRDDRAGSGGSPDGNYPGGTGAKPEGPIVKIARGNSVTVVPVGGKD
ncbi:Flp pilus assembly protein CpaB [Sphingomonas sp. MG17]|jgi:pilus assembly protein CpaB|uniref:Flp pilus assembly protein CpaB n=1 Tax=Sphingomonas tagetis TaxID=2949092 RepID=A0A9X2HK60_9SPHN|nr:Flp pilus assembly protein CpaB [Sphingomonas tagetis]MCP3730146.1 Flp pilus assembly protein CpaB [Sphingomonas tagetis]